MYYPYSENTAKLICVFVFAYAKSWFSHGGAQVIMCSGGHYNYYYIACWCWTPGVSCEGGWRWGGGWEHTFYVLS